MELYVKCTKDDVMLNNMISRSKTLISSRSTPEFYSIRFRGVVYV